MYHAPVLDRIYLPSSHDQKSEQPRIWRQEDVMGLKKFIEGVEHHEQQIQSMINSGMPPQEDPLPSVQGLETFWKVVVSCKPPVVGVRMPMGRNKGGSCSGPENNGRKAPLNGGHRAKNAKEVWVDVLADGGKEWIRIYSKKVSHLLTEFREQDSYLNSDFDSDSQAGSQDGNGRQQYNSLLATARDLRRAASHAPRIPGAPSPKLSLWLTRIPSTPEQLPPEYLDPESPIPEWPDNRIPQTLATLKEWGVTVHHLSPPPLSQLSGHPVPKPPPPSMKINFDITALLGLCSDVLHYPLPKDNEEAAKRSLRPMNQLIGKESAVRGRDGTGKGKGKGRREMNAEDEEDGFLKGQSQNSRELYRCILEEMERPWVEEFNAVMTEAWEEHKKLYGMTGNEPQVEFWAAKEAAQYTFEALTSGPAHGLGAEQRRMKRMLGYENGDVFEGSRYEGKEGVLKGFKVKIFDAEALDSGEVERTGFHVSLEAISKAFLDEYYTSLQPSDLIKKSQGKFKPSILPNFLQPKKISAPPVAKITLPFPVVSLHSLCRGAREGMTTVMMGTATFKEVWGQSRWKVRGWERAGYNLEPSEDREKGSAAVMIFPYRVFGEGKRVRFEKGDYSYPNPRA